MSDDPNRERELPAVDHLRETFRGELMRAAHHPRTRAHRLRRGVVVSLAVLAAAAVPAGIAASERLIGSDPRPIPGVISIDGEWPREWSGAVAVDEGPGTRVGFVDQASGEAIRCADGEPLTAVIKESRDAGAIEDGIGIPAPPEDASDAPFTYLSLPATCADGSIPDVYQEAAERGELAIFRVD